MASSNNKPTAQHDDGPVSTGGFMGGIDLGSIISNVFSGNPFSGWADVFKSAQPGTEFSLDEVNNNLEMDWDDTIQAGAKGAMSAIGIKVTTKGKVKAESRLKGAFKRLFESGKASEEKK